MKNLYRYALIVVAVALFGVSCVSDGYELDVIDPNAESVGQLKVHFSVKDSELVTRAAQDVSYEHNVQSIYVFVFSGDNRVTLSGSNDEDPNGNINYFDLDEIESAHNKSTETDAASTGVLNLGAVAGSNMRICLIANIGVSNSETRAEMTNAISKEVEVFDDIQKYSDLQKLVLKLGVNSVQRQSAFLLTGEKTGVSLKADPDAVTEVTVPLYRTDAKITFNVKAENADLQDFKFVPKTWRVMNAPATTYAIPNSEVSAETSIGVGEYLDASNVKSENDDVNYFDSPEVSFEGKVQDDVENSGTFTFYMYENLKGPKLEIGENGSYALREKQKKNKPETDDVLVPGQTVINGNYMYAPELGTYVVFTGQLSYTKSTTANGTTYNEYVMADVEYSVHLGHNSDTDFDDYKTLRNHHYTYNVTVKGVNDLLVEVEGVSGDGNNKEEQRPGVEGEVVMSSAKLIEIDGHYDRALITFTPEEAKTIFFAVQTPWERGLDTNGFLEGEANSYVNDYKWIKFLINREYNIANNAYAPFPGEQCYDGGTTKFGTAKPSGAHNAYNEGVILRDIRQLSNYFAQNNPTENVTVTAFIDEYLYNYNPRDDDNRVTSKDNDGTSVSTTYKSITDTRTTDELLLWKRSVNNNARMMHIVKKGDMKYSEDGQTSLSRSVVSIYQKPILSLYNHMATNLKTAWGVETVNETPKMEVTRTAYNYIDDTNYYTAAQTLISGKNNSNSLSWSSVISQADRYGLQTSYNDPSYACALRNRDLNGDGTINQNEVLWYLAALDQMSGLWIAEPIFTDKLFDPDNPDGTYIKEGVNNNNPIPATHYVTSTIHINHNSPMVYWAEEFGATSSHRAAKDWSQAPEDNDGKAVVSLRCVRNLGMSYDSKEIPQDYYIVKQPGGVTDVTETVLADGIVDENDVYTTREAIQVDESEYHPNAPQVDDDTSWSNNTKSNAYGYVQRTSYGYYTYYSYYNYKYSITGGPTEGSIDLTYINAAALRTAPDSGVPLAYGDINGSTENNRPFVGFFIHNDDQIVYNWRNAYNNEIANTSLCPAGYRMPNQREMILMTVAIDKDNWSNKVYTMFNGNYNTDIGQFASFYYISPQADSGWNPDRVTRMLHNSIDNKIGTDDRTWAVSQGQDTSVKDYVRCVRDNTDAKLDDSSQFEDEGDNW